MPSKRNVIGKKNFEGEKKSTQNINSMGRKKNTPKDLTSQFQSDSIFL